MDVQEDVTHAVIPTEAVIVRSVRPSHMPLTVTDTDDWRGTFTGASAVDTGPGSEGEAVGGIVMYAGTAVGPSVKADGIAEGRSVGRRVGAADGTDEGLSVGRSESNLSHVDGISVGIADGAREGAKVGDGVGTRVGLHV